MLEKCKSAVDKGKIFGALLTDLSNAFHCILQTLIFEKLRAYGFSLRVLRSMMHSDFNNRKKRSRENDDFSTWKKILFGVPKGSILGPLFFNIFLYDLLLVMKETSFTSYAKENAPYVIAESLVKSCYEVIKSLEGGSIKLF